MLLAELLQSQAFAEKIEAIPDFPAVLLALVQLEIGGRQDRPGMIHHDVIFDHDRVAGIIVAAAQVIAKPALRHREPRNAGIREQGRFAE